jgi:hypothetical protein
MKKLRMFNAALTLFLCLAIPTFAGEIGTGYVPPPPPVSGSSASTDSTAADGEIGTGKSETAAGPSITAVAISIMTSVLSLI